MSHEIHASLRLVLPDEAKEMAASLALVTAEWAKLVHAMEGRQAIMGFTVGEPHRGGTNGAKRRRRRRDAHGVLQPLAQVQMPPVSVS